MFEQTLFEIVSATLFALALIHGIRRYDPRRLLIALATVAVMLVAEENAVMMLTNNYAYYEYHLWVGRLPVAIALAWLVVVYLGFQCRNRISWGFHAQTDVRLHTLICLAKDLLSKKWMHV